MRFAVAVDDLQDGTADAARNAALIQREVGRRVERAGTVGAAWHRAALDGRQDLRHATVRRIDEQARLREGASRVVEPERGLRRRIALVGGTADLLLTRLHRGLVQV
jgi:phosphoserine phosphatase